MQWGCNSKGSAPTLTVWWTPVCPLSWGSTLESCSEAEYELSTALVGKRLWVLLLLWCLLAQCQFLILSCPILSMLEGVPHFWWACSILAQFPVQIQHSNSCTFFETGYLYCCPGWLLANRLKWLSCLSLPSSEGCRCMPLHLAQLYLSFGLLSESWASPGLGNRGTAT